MRKSCIFINTRKKERKQAFPQIIRVTEFYFIRMAETLETKANLATVTTTGAAEKVID